MEYACGAETISPLRRAAAAVPDRNLRKFLDELAGRKVPRGTSTALVREFYVRCLDPAARETGLRELRHRLDEIGTTRTLPELAAVLGALRAEGLDVLLSLTPYWEARPGASRVARFDLKAPALDRPEYARADRRAALRVYWQRLAALTGSLSERDVEGAIRVDAWLATQPDLDNSDPAIHQDLVSQEARQKALFPWDRYLKALGVSPEIPLLPVAAETLGVIDAFARFSVSDLVSYVRLRLVVGSSYYLTQPFLDERRRFFAKESKGEKKASALDLPATCVEDTAAVLEPWLADSYLSPLASAPAEQSARYLFERLRRQLIQRLQTIDWMDEKTRRSVETKVAKTRLQFVGDVVDVLPKIDVPSGSFLGVMQAAARIANRVQLDKIGRSTEPPSLNASFMEASYSSLINAVWVSPELIRPPFLATGAPDVVTFGALGAFLAHELAHVWSPGAGRRFDASGFRVETWSPGALAAYRTRIACLEARLESFGTARKKFEGPKLVDEHFADLVAVELALRTLEAEVGRPKTSSLTDRLHREFFVAYGQMACAASGDPEVAVDAVHAPTRVRINGVLSDLPQFARAFRCVPDAPLNPRARCSVW